MKVLSLIHIFTASQIITVMANNAENSLSTTDDFFFISKGMKLEQALLKPNDFDPENGTFSVNAVGSQLSPISIPSGEYYINSAGELYFTPEITFAGPVDIVYTVCDQQNFCVNATAHILVLENMRLRIRVYLEGAIMENDDAKSSENKPLMRDNLRISPFTGSNYIPVVDPYTVPGPVSYTHLDVYKRQGWARGRRPVPAGRRESRCSR